MVVAYLCCHSHKLDYGGACCGIKLKHFNQGRAFIIPSELVSQLRKFLQQPGNSLNSSLNTNAKYVKAASPCNFKCNHTIETNCS